MSWSKCFATKLFPLSCPSLHRKFFSSWVRYLASKLELEIARCVQSSHFHQGIKTKQYLPWFLAFPRIPMVRFLENSKIDLLRMNKVEYTRSGNLTGRIVYQIKDEIREFFTHFSTKGILGKESQSSPRRFGPAVMLGAMRAICLELKHLYLLIHNWFGWKSMWVVH